MQNQLHVTGKPDSLHSLPLLQKTVLCLLLPTEKLETDEERKNLYLHL